MSATGSAIAVSISDETPSRKPAIASPASVIFSFYDIYHKVSAASVVVSSAASMVSLAASDNSPRIPSTEFDPPSSSRSILPHD
ncbi:MAG: hypothetical protein H6937_05165 [Burkholderiales bacterium]|nr:hypothetical protein [Burkholderiales bacterium]